VDLNSRFEAAGARLGKGGMQCVEEVCVCRKGCEVRGCCGGEVPWL